MDFKELVEYAKQNECSDIHITVGTNLAIRRFGTLQILEPAPSVEESRNMIFSVLDQEQVDTVMKGKDLDVGVMLWDGTRIRANIYHQRNNLAASIRILFRKSRSPTHHRHVVRYRILMEPSAAGYSYALSAPPRYDA